MLVLSRQLDQTIMIGDDVQITVVEVKGDKVRLGIRAPRSLQVHRKEVYDDIHRANAEASLSPDEARALTRAPIPPARAQRAAGPAANVRPMRLTPTTPRSITALPRSA